MAKQGRKRQAPRGREEAERRLEETGEAGGFVEEARTEKVHKTPQYHYSGRTIGDTATSYSSVGGAEDPEEWVQRVPERDDNAPDYETPGGTNPAAEFGPVHDIAFRPAPGGYIEKPGRPGRNVPFTGEVVSTRDATFEEDPDTGKTASEEAGEFIRESLEERTRGYESG